MRGKRSNEIGAPAMRDQCSLWSDRHAVSPDAPAIRSQTGTWTETLSSRKTVVSPNGRIFKNKLFTTPRRPYGKSIVRSRQPVFSRTPANVGKDSHPRRRSSADSASCMGTRSFVKNWDAMIPARVAQDVAFKNCCLHSGRYDGSLRNHYFVSSG